MAGSSPRFCHRQPWESPLKPERTVAFPGAREIGVQGLGFGVWGLWLGVLGLGFGVWGLGLGSSGVGFRDEVAGFRADGSEGMHLTA